MPTEMILVINWLTIALYNIYLISEKFTKWAQNDIFLSQVLLSHKQHAIKPGQARVALRYLLTSYVSTRAMKPDGNAMANEIHAANSPSDASEAGSDNSGASFSRHWVHRSSIS